MSYDIDERVKDMTTALEAFKKTAKAYPDARRDALGTGWQGEPRHIWVSNKLQKADCDAIEVVAQGHGPSAPIFALHKLVEDGVPIYPRQIHASALTVMQRLRDKHPDLYRQLVGIIKEM